MKTRVGICLVALGGLACSSNPSGNSAGRVGTSREGLTLGGIPLLAPVVTCSSGLDILHVAYTGIPASWDSSAFDLSLRDDLGNPSTNPWYLLPEGLEASWIAFPLPDSYPDSVTDLVASYANVEPVFSRLAQCTTTTLLENGEIITSSPTTYVIWDPRTGGTGGGPY